MNVKLCNMYTFSLLFYTGLIFRQYFFKFPAFFVHYEQAIMNVTIHAQINVLEL